jgi:AMIN domain-containing protein
LKTLAICAVLLAGCLQLNGIPVQAGKQVATIRHIAVTGGDHDLDVEITATVPTTARTQTVTDPDRLIVDLAESLPGAGLHKIFVNRGKLIDVRVGLLSANPRITRVVLDLTSPTQYRVLPMGNTIVVKLSGESGPGPAPVAATTMPPAETRPAQTASVVTLPPPPARSPEPNRARWIMPILVTAAVLAMLVIAVVSHIQNKRASRGL